MLLDGFGADVRKSGLARSGKRAALAGAGGARRAARSGASLAIDNLRAVVILLVLSFHSVLAYLSFLPAAPFRFDRPPYEWTAFPIVDSHRWVGFDLFCAWQNIFLMTLFFFLSGLFVWPSLKRKGAGRFLSGRALRLGVPFAIVTALLMPVATYPSYLQSAADPSVAAYWHEFLALPFWPSGPMWFLWLLLVGDIAAALCYWRMPRQSEALVHALSAEEGPSRRLMGLLVASVLAYVPLALAFGPMQWTEFGPFSFQLSRPVFYAVYFFAGVGLGARGVERPLFAPDGPLVRRWPSWLAAAPASFALWIALSAWVIGDQGGAPLVLRIADDLSFALATLANCFCALAVTLRFGRRFSRLLDSLKDNAYGMYIIHYVFVVWLQYALLPAALPAVVKGGLVFAGTLLASWGAAAALRRLPAVAQILGAGRPRGAVAAS